MSKYTIESDETGFMLMRGGERMERPNNAELQFWMERESYRKALEAAQRVMWMAEKYAEGGRVESEDYEQAQKDIAVALAECGL
jgi:hypothetical protein